MTSRDDLNRLSAAQRELVRMARNELAGFFAAVDLSRPELVRDALVEIVPLLVQEYGELAAVSAAEWYEQVHPGGFLARTADSTFPVDGVTQSVRYHAGALWESEAPVWGEGADGDLIQIGVRSIPPDPARVLAGISGALQRFVYYSGRETVARNVQLDPSRPRFARVPSGAKTCAFCNLLASRGFVYFSRATAGERSDWHDDCDCQVVPEWDATGHHIAGYDPDAMYDRYLQARHAAGSSDPKVILSSMREMFPDEYTDGHVH